MERRKRQKSQISNMVSRVSLTVMWVFPIFCLHFIRDSVFVLCLGPCLAARTTSTLICLRVLLVCSCNSLIRGSCFSSWFLSPFIFWARALGFFFPWLWRIFVFVLTTRTMLLGSLSSRCSWKGKACGEMSIGPPLNPQPWLSWLLGRRKMPRLFLGFWGPLSL